jgi:mono/diheme cytochrome c family protein
MNLFLPTFCPGTLLPRHPYALRIFLLVFALATSLPGHAAGPNDRVTGVAGESWLNHLHRTLEDTSMGKTGRLGLPTSVSAEESPSWQRALSYDFSGQAVTLKGADLYRLNCQGCHGESGLGAPPEINSVINPVRSASVALIMERMKKVGMDMSRADAAELANQSKAALLQRLHNGGTDMPPFPHLTEPEVRAILAYLNQLAGVPGAEKQQVAVEESSFRVGQHIVKSTCHICHNAAGPNPNPEQISQGAIPPLSTLTMRTSLPEFIRKVRSGAPIVMGTPPLPCRGRMPVFYYLSENEAADVYLYLQRYPPYQYAVLDPANPAPKPDEVAAGTITAFAPITEAAKAFQSTKDAGMRIVAVPLLSELLVALLFAGGLGFTLREFRRLTKKSQARKVLVMATGNVALDATDTTSLESPSHESERVTEFAASDSVATVVAGDDRETVNYLPSHDADHRSFESSWLARRLEDEDWVA